MLRTRACLHIHDMITIDYIFFSFRMTTELRKTSERRQEVAKHDWINKESSRKKKQVKEKRGQMEEKNIDRPTAVLFYYFFTSLALLFFFSLITHRADTGLSWKCRTGHWIFSNREPRTLWAISQPWSLWTTKLN